MNKIETAIVGVTAAAYDNIWQSTGCRDIY